MLRLRHVLQHGRPATATRPASNAPRKPRSASSTRCRPTRPCRSTPAPIAPRSSARAKRVQPRPGRSNSSRRSGGDVASRPISYPGLTEALAAAKRGTAPAKEIYVFTDMQKTGFERQQGALKAKCEEIASAGEPHLHPLRQPGAEGSRTSRSLDVKLVSDIPHTRTRVPFVDHAQEHRRRDRQGPARCRLELDGRAVEKDAMQVDAIEPDQTYTRHAHRRARRGRVSASSRSRSRATGLPGDNVLYKTILVRDKVRVLLVDGTPESGQSRSKPATTSSARRSTPRSCPTTTSSPRPSRPWKPARATSKTRTSSTCSTPRCRGIASRLAGEPDKGNRLAGLSDEFVDKLAEFVTQRRRARDLLRRSSPRVARSG